MAFERETWVGGTTAATAAMLNRIENGIVAIDTCAGSVPASPTRVVNTTYRNETGKTIMVMVTVNGAAFPTETFRVNYWPPNQTVFAPYNRIRILSHNTSIQNYPNEADGSFSFAVPPLYYYEVHCVDVSGKINNSTIDKWVEMPLE